MTAQAYGAPHVQVAPHQIPTHPVPFAYLFWLLGVFGAHRFYLGKPVTGAIWFFTGGLLLVGWVVDLFLIPSMCEESQKRFRTGQNDYTLIWLLHVFLGPFGIHRLYMGKIITGVIFLLTGGLFGVGYVYDWLTLNSQIDELNRAS
ncbi:MAG: TM2 domain-containing protein [Planctomycetota bacterium]